MSGPLELLSGGLSKAGRPLESLAHETQEKLLELTKGGGPLDAEKNKESTSESTLASGIMDMDAAMAKWRNGSFSWY